MANGEDGIRQAIRTGDAAKVAAAYDRYAASMERAGQKPKPLSAFTR